MNDSNRANKKGTFSVGTSNITLPGTKNTFPEAYRSATRLAYYGSLFNTLEINSSFYKVPMPATFEKWSNEVADGFKFTVKLWREITHAKALTGKLDDINFFMKAANRIDNKKKGCLLIQFPASITINFIGKIQKILKRITGLNTGHQWNVCVEFRHISWYTREMYAMLDGFNASLVLHDMPASIMFDLHTAAKVVYLRFHGIKGDYKGTYDDVLLKKYAAKIKMWIQEGKDVYAYFNNTIGAAFENARRLSDLVQ
ncbi:MAG: DUF72 domain-containing protein [Bacteroidota bacterium]